MKKVIFTEKAPAAIGPYSQAVEVNGMVFLSGQIPVDPATGEDVYKRQIPSHELHESPPQCSG